MQLTDIIDHFAQYSEVQTELITQSEKYKMNQLVSSSLNMYFQQHETSSISDILNHIGIPFHENSGAKQFQYQYDFRKRYVITLILHKIINGHLIMQLHKDSNKMQLAEKEQSKINTMKQELIRQVSPLEKLLKLLQQNIEAILKLYQYFKSNDINLNNKYFNNQYSGYKSTHKVNYKKLIEDDFNITNWLSNIQIELLQLTCESLMKFNQNIIINQIQDYILNFVEQINKLNIQFDSSGDINIDSNKIFECIVIIGSLLSSLGQYYAQNYVIIKDGKHTIQNEINNQIVKVIYVLISVLMSKISYTYIKESTGDEIKQQLQSKINSEVPHDQDQYQRFLGEICLYCISVFTLPLLMRTDGYKEYSFQNIYSSVDSFKTMIDAITYIFNDKNYVFSYVQQSLSACCLQLKQESEEVSHSTLLAVYQRKMSLDVTKLLQNQITEQNLNIFVQHLVYGIFYGDVQIGQIHNLLQQINQDAEKDYHTQILVWICVIKAINSLYTLHTGHYITGVHLDCRWDDVYLNCFYSENFQTNNINLIKQVEAAIKNNQLVSCHNLHISDLFTEYEAFQGQSIVDLYGNCQECIKILNVFTMIIPNALKVDDFYRLIQKSSNNPFLDEIIERYLNILEITKYFESAQYIDALKIHYCVCMTYNTKKMLNKFIKMGQICQLVILDSLCCYSIGNNQQESIVMQLMQRNEYKQSKESDVGKENSVNVHNTKEQQNTFNFQYLETDNKLIECHIQCFYECCDFKCIDQLINIIVQENNSQQQRNYHEFSSNNLQNQEQLIKQLDSINWEKPELQVTQTITMMINIVNIFCFISDSKYNKLKSETQLLTLLSTFLQNKDQRSQNNLSKFECLSSFNLIDKNILSKLNDIKYAFFIIVTQALTQETMQQIQQIMIYGIHNADLFSKFISQKVISQIHNHQLEHSHDIFLKRCITSSIVLDLYDIIQLLQSFSESQVNQCNFQSWVDVKMLLSKDIQQNAQQINDNITKIYNEIIKKQTSFQNIVDSFPITQQYVYLDKSSSGVDEYAYLPFIFPKVYTEHLAKEEQDNTLTKYDLKLLNQKPQTVKKRVAEYQLKALLNTSIAFSTQLVKNKFKYSYLYSGSVNSNMQAIICGQVIDNFAKLLSAYLAHMTFSSISKQTFIILTEGFAQFIAYHLQYAGFNSLLSKSDIWMKHLDQTKNNLYILILKTYFYLYTYFSEENPNDQWNECKQASLELIAKMLLILSDEENDYQMRRFDQQSLQYEAYNTLAKLNSVQNTNVHNIDDSYILIDIKNTAINFLKPTFILQLIQDVELEDWEIASFLRLRIVETLNLKDFFQFIFKTQSLKKNQISNNLILKLERGALFNDKMFEFQIYTILPKIITRIMQWQGDGHQQVNRISHDNMNIYNYCQSPALVIANVNDLAGILQQLYQNIQNNQPNQQIQYFYAKTASYLIKLAEQLLIMDEINSQAIISLIKKIQQSDIRSVSECYENVLGILNTSFGFYNADQSTHHFESERNKEYQEFQHLADQLQQQNNSFFSNNNGVNNSQQSIEQNYLYQQSKDYSFRQAATQQINLPLLSFLGNQTPGTVFALFIMRLLSRQQIAQYIWHLARFQHFSWARNNTSQFQFPKTMGRFSEDINLLQNEKTILNVQDQIVLMQILFLQSPFTFIEYFNHNVFENALVAVQQLIAMDVLKQKTQYNRFQTQSNSNYKHQSYQVTEVPLFYNILINRNLNAVAPPSAFHMTGSSDAHRYDCTGHGSQGSQGSSGSHSQTPVDEALLPRLAQRQVALLVFAFQLAVLHEITASNPVMLDALAAACVRREQMELLGIESIADVTQIIISALKIVSFYFGIKDSHLFTTQDGHFYKLDELLEKLLTAYETCFPWVQTQIGVFTPITVQISKVQKEYANGENRDPRTTSEPRNMQFDPKAAFKRMLAKQISLCDNNEKLGQKDSKNNKQTTQQQQAQQLNQEMLEETQKTINDYNQIKISQDRLRNYQFQLIKFTREWVLGIGTRLSAVSGGQTNYGYNITSLQHYANITQNSVKQQKQPNQSINNQQQHQQAPGSPGSSQIQIQGPKEEFNDQNRFTHVLSGSFQTANFFNPLFRKELTRILQFAYKQNVQAEPQRATTAKQQINKLLIQLLYKFDGRLSDPRHARRALQAQVLPLITVISILTISKTNIFHCKNKTVIRQEWEQIVDLVQTCVNQYVAGDVEWPIIIQMVNLLILKSSSCLPNDETSQTLVHTLVWVCEVCGDVGVVRRCCIPLRHLYVQDQNLPRKAQILIVASLIHENKLDEALSLWFKQPAAFQIDPEPQKLVEYQKQSGISENGEVSKTQLQCFQIFMLVEAAKAYQLENAIKLLVGPFLAYHAKKPEVKRKSAQIQVQKHKIVGNVSLEEQLAEVFNMKFK